MIIECDHRLTALSAFSSVWPARCEMPNHQKSRRGSMLDCFSAAEPAATASVLLDTAMAIASTVQMFGALELDGYDPVPAGVRPAAPRIITPIAPIFGFDVS